MRCSASGRLGEAIHELRGDELRLMRALMGMRSLGRSRGGAETVLRGFRRMGFRAIAEEPGSELVIAGIGRFWKLSGGLRRGRGRRPLPPPSRSPATQVAFNFHLAEGELSTETRIAGTDADARRRFGMYWMLVRPGSGLIRREWLRAIASKSGG